MTIWESPDITERLVDYRDGVPWEVYFKNGLTIALTDAIVRDYGKWHRVNVVISNNSLTPIEFNPETDIIAYSVDKHDVATDLQVWSYNSYLKKVNRSQTWSVVLKVSARDWLLPVQAIRPPQRPVTAATVVTTITAAISLIRLRPQLIMPPMPI